MRLTISIIGLIACLVHVGCLSGPPRGEGSFLLVTVSGFRADELTCDNSGDTLTPQFDAVCKESVRYTHAYTPSVLSIPALASILTGLYPVEHGVHRNGASQYNFGVESLAERARKMGLETFLVSGGVPILRKTAISKGFTDFDDSIRSNGSFYRKAPETARKLLALIENRSEESSFLAVAQLADLAFPEDTLFKTNREEGASGKLQEIDEALGILRNELIHLKIWDPLTVVVVGLQGKERAEHAGLSNGISLYDEVVRVPLLIKPARKPRDLGLSWKVDENITLVDLGQTLLKLLNPKAPATGKLHQMDFSESLFGHDIRLPERPLFSESDLPPWRGWGPRINSIRLGELVYWMPPDPKLFNTYTDHLELRNLLNTDYNFILKFQKRIQPYLKEWADLEPVTEHLKNVPFSIGEKLRVAKLAFSRTYSPEEKLKALSELQIRRREDWQIVQWQASILVDNQDWIGLRTLASERKEDNPDTRLWRTFIKLKFRGSGSDEVSDADPLSSCLFLAPSLKRFSVTELENLQNQQSCKDPETQTWLNAFVQMKQHHTKEASAFFDLAKGISEKKKEQMEFARLFWSEGATWDFNTNLPEGPSVFSLFSALASSSEFLDFTKRKQFP